LNDTRRTMKTAPGTKDWLKSWAFLNKPITQSCTWSFRVNCHERGVLNVYIGVANKQKAKQSTQWELWGKGNGAYIISYTP
jgi:hypothetical protein